MARAQLGLSLEADVDRFSLPFVISRPVAVGTVPLGWNYVLLRFSGTRKLSAAVVSHGVGACVVAPSLGPTGAKRKNSSSN